MNRSTWLLRSSALIVTLIFALTSLSNTVPRKLLPNRAQNQQKQKKVSLGKFTPPTRWRSEKISISSPTKEAKESPVESSLGLSISPKSSTFASDVQAFLSEHSFAASPDGVKISSDRGELIGRTITVPDQMMVDGETPQAKAIRFILYGNVDGNDYAYTYEFAYSQDTQQILRGTATNLNGDGYEVNYETGEAFKLYGSGSGVKVAATSQADINCILENLKSCSTYASLISCVITVGTGCLSEFFKAILIDLACNITLFCQPLPSFGISVTPSSRSIKQGETATYTVQATFLNGFRGPVSDFSVSNLPSGASVSFSPSAINSSSGSTTLKISTSGATQTASRTLTISAKGGGQMKTATTGLTVDVGRGTILVNATLNGAEWRGSLTYGISGTAIGGGTSVPKTHTDMAAGAYGLTFLFGGPPNAILSSITPFNLTLSPGSTATFTLNFISPPVASSNLQAVTVSSSQINLRWNDNSNNESEFRIERKRTASGFWSEIMRVGSNVTTYTDSGLSANTTYFYRVRASNSAGQSGYSNEASATTRK